MAVVNANDFEKLPTEPRARWIALRDLLEDRIYHPLYGDEQPSLDEMLEYAHVLSNAAEELGLGTLDIPATGNIREEFLHFRSQTIGLATRLSIKEGNAAVLSEPVKEGLLKQSSILRRMILQNKDQIANANRLLDLLDQFEKQVDEGGLDLGKTMRIFAYVAVGLYSTTGFLADAPQALSTINHLVGLQMIANEDAAQSPSLPRDPAVPKLPLPPRLLSPPEVD